MGGAPAEALAHTESANGRAGRTATETSCLYSEMEIFAIRATLPRSRLVQPPVRTRLVFAFGPPIRCLPSTHRSSPIPAHPLPEQMSSSSTRSLSPPPRMPSPQPLHTPLPSPHLIQRQRSRQRLISAPQSPPIPPTLIGSPLLKKTVAYPRQRVLSSQLKADIWLDGDDFGTRKEKSHSPPLTPSPGRERQPGRGFHRRVASISISPRARARSPPPSPPRSGPPPPVPPIPAFYLSAGDRKPILQPRDTNLHPVVPIYIPDLRSLSSESDASSRARLGVTCKSNDAMTCIKFFSIHNGGRTTSA